MRAIITVVARDSVGIIAHISAFLADYNINIMDISQTVMQEYFTMIMLVDMSRCIVDFDAVRQALREHGEKKNLAIRIQREDIFQAMHRI